MSNDCETKELYSLEWLQTIWVPADLELNIRLKKADEELNDQINLINMNIRRLNWLSTKSKQ